MFVSCCWLNFLKVVVVVFGFFISWIFRELKRGFKGWFKYVNVYKIWISFRGLKDFVIFIVCWVMVLKRVGVVCSMEVKVLVVLVRFWVLNFDNLLRVVLVRWFIFFLKSVLFLIFDSV